VTASADARVRLEVERMVDRLEARAGYLVSDSGIVSAAAGDSSEVDAPTVVSLIAAQTSAAAALASLVCGREFSEFLQQGVHSAVFVRGFRGGWIIALLFDRPDLRLSHLHRSDEHVRGLEEAIEQLLESSSRGTAAGVGGSWADEAESRIDRIFREEA
jgi:hypothetical protein